MRRPRSGVERSPDQQRSARREKLSRSIAWPEKVADKHTDDEAGGGGEPRVFLRPAHQPVTNCEVISGAEQRVEDGDDKDGADAQAGDYDDADLHYAHGVGGLGWYLRGRYQSHFPKKAHMMQTTISEPTVARFVMVEMQRTNHVIGQKTDCWLVSRSTSE